jgi:hypothetical protein
MTVPHMLRDPLPRLRGRVREGALRAHCISRGPLPIPPPQAGKGVLCRASRRIPVASRR